jgi:hypothetical protein
MKILVIAVLLAIVASLGQAAFALAPGRAHGTQVARALTLRIALSLGLFAFLMAGWYFGFLTPHAAG